MGETKTVCKEPIRFEEGETKYTVVDPSDVCHPLLKLVEERMGRVVITPEEYQKLKGLKAEKEKEV